MTLYEKTLDPSAAVAPPGPTFHDLMASIGYLLFQWSLLDRSLDEEIARLRRASGDSIGLPVRPRTVSERLAEWRALIARGRRRMDEQAVESVAARIRDYQRLRNLVATGFVSATSDDGEPAIRCAHGTSRLGVTDEIRMSVSDIINAIDAMELCRSEIGLLHDLGPQ